MRFAVKVAIRYMLSSPGQTGLLVAGVGLGVLVFVFITALIRGLAIFLVAETTGQIAHVTLEPPVRAARVLVEGPALAAQPVSTAQRLQIREWQKALTLAQAQPETAAARVVISGNAFLARGEAATAVAVQGVEPEAIDAIARISPKIVEGRARLGSGEALIGRGLANDLGLRLGRPLTLRSDRGTERLLTIAGIFETGVGSLDERVVIVSLSAARPLFDLPNGASSIEIRLKDPDTAPAVALRLGAATGLKSTPWQEKNRSLQSALEGQGRTGSLIQIFALVSIIIGVSSALLLSAYRRRPEIGIMRSFGVSRGFVATVFITQGIIIGAVGAGTGCLLGFGFVSLLAGIKDAGGEQILPVVPSEGGYLAAFILTTLGAALAAALPARDASRIDPVEAIQQ